MAKLDNEGIKKLGTAGTSEEIKLFFEHVDDSKLENLVKQVEGMLSANEQFRGIQDLTIRKKTIERLKFFINMAKEHQLIKDVTSKKTSEEIESFIETADDDQMKRFANHATEDQIILLMQNPIKEHVIKFLKATNNANSERQDLIVNLILNEPKLQLNFIKNITYFIQQADDKLTTKFKSTFVDKKDKSERELEQLEFFNEISKKDTSKKTNLDVNLALRNADIKQLAKKGSSEDIEKFLDQTVLSLPDVELFLTSSTPETFALFKEHADKDQLKRFATLIKKTDEHQAILQCKKVSPQLEDHRKETFNEMKEGIAEFKGTEEDREKLIKISLELWQQVDLGGMAQKVLDFTAVLIPPTPVKKVSSDQDDSNLPPLMVLEDSFFEKPLKSNDSSTNSFSSSSLGGDDSSLSSAANQPEVVKRNGSPRQTKLKKLTIEPAPLSLKEQINNVEVLAKFGTPEEIKSFLKFNLRQEDIKLFLDNANPTQLELFIKHASDGQIKDFAKMANQLGILTFLAKATTAQIVIFSKNADDNQVKLFLDNAKGEHANKVNIFIENASDSQMLSFARYATSEQISSLRENFKADPNVITKFEKAFKNADTTIPLTSLNKATESSNLGGSQTGLDEYIATTTPPFDIEATNTLKALTPQEEAHKDIVMGAMRNTITKVNNNVNNRDCVNIDELVTLYMRLHELKDDASQIDKIGEEFGNMANKYSIPSTVNSVSDFKEELIKLRADHDTANNKKDENLVEVPFEHNKSPGG